MWKLRQLHSVYYNNLKKKERGFLFFLLMSFLPSDLVSVRIRFEGSRFGICCDEVEDSLTISTLLEQVKSHIPVGLQEGLVQLTYLDGQQLMDVTDRIRICKRNVNGAFNYEFILRTSTEEEQRLIKRLPELDEEEDEIRGKRSFIYQQLEEIKQIYKKAKK